MSQAGLARITSGNLPPEVPTSFVTNSGTAIPVAHVLNVLGTTVAAGSIPYRFIGSGNTVTGQIQTSQAIGATNATKIGLSAYSSAQFTVDANGFVTLAGGTGPALLTLSDDVNAIVTPSGSGNIQLVGHIVEQGATKFSTIVAGTNLLNVNPMSSSRWIVDPLGFNGTHTTITSAIASAVSGDTIILLPGTYTENFTIKPGIVISAWTGDGFNPNVMIIGKITMQGGGTSSISHVRLQTSADFLVVVSGANPCNLKLLQCFINCTNNTGISFTNSNANSTILLNNCYGNLGTTGIALFAHSSAGNLSIQYSNFTNSGASTTANTISAGSLNFFYSSLKNPITSSGTSAIGYELSDFSTVAQNVISLTIGGSGSASISNCRISSGTASAISVGAAATVGIAQTDIFSSNTNATTGAGATVVNCISYTGTSITSNVTTQTGGTLTGLTNISPSAGYLGERIVSAVTGGTPANNTATTLTSIVLTPGVWDLCGITSFSYNGNNTASVMSLSPTNNTLTGNTGDQEDQFSQVNVAGFIVGLSVPGWRVAVTTNTTYYLVVFTLFSTGAATVNGRISATRVG